MLLEGSRRAPAGLMILAGLAARSGGVADTTALLTRWDSAVLGRALGLPHACKPTYMPHTEVGATALWHRIVDAPRYPSRINLDPLEFKSVAPSK